MKSTSRSNQILASIAIPDDVAAKCDVPKQFENFDKLFRAVIAVPKAAIDKEEAKWRKARAGKSRKKLSKRQEND